eukprot:566739-Pyramimonas_sp.AAC.1
MYRLSPRHLEKGGVDRLQVIALTPTPRRGCRCRSRAPTNKARTATLGQGVLGLEHGHNAGSWRSGCL